MTISEIDIRIDELNTQKSQIKAILRELVARRDELFAQVEAWRKVDQMSDTERQALAQAIQAAAGIESGEQVTGF